FQFECIDLTALDPDRVGYAGDGAGGLQDRGLNRATKAAIRHGKHEDTRRAALVVMLHDCTLNGILGAVPALTGGHSASPSGPRARARSTSRAGLARGRLLSQVSTSSSDQARVFGPSLRPGGKPSSATRRRNIGQDGMMPRSRRSANRNQFFDMEGAPVDLT